MLYQSTSAEQKYHLKGKNPSLLIISGIHGDEYDVVPIVEKTVEKYYHQLSDFLYIYAGSPSAISNKTRENGQKNDLNRNFKPGTKDNEAYRIMELLKRYQFIKSFDFHEDPIDSSFYIYDCYEETLENSSEWINLKKEITNLGVNLLNGIDDPNDPALGIEFEDGLHYFPNTTSEDKNGMLGSWLRTEGITKKYLNPEIPGKLTLGKKGEIIDAIFRRLILHV